MTSSFSHHPYKTLSTSPANMPTWSSNYQQNTIIPCACLCCTYIGSSVHVPSYFPLTVSDVIPSRSVQEYHKQNLMTARNLGVVFGRTCLPYESPLIRSQPATAATLMRSRNPSAEFSDMAGKALTIEWLVENAPTIFPPFSTTH